MWRPTFGYSKASISPVNWPRVSWATTHDEKCPSAMRGVADRPRACTRSAASSWSWMLPASAALCCVHLQDLALRSSRKVDRYTWPRLHTCWFRKKESYLCFECVYLLGSSNNTINTVNKPTKRVQRVVSTSKGAGINKTYLIVLGK